ncbi:hypothetical protein K461DRAFT_316337 [Myriangium duriaei CBS 260.36]|uniref:CHAT domain-containing protein n=1 Tax=Myriangium duriaei CBS 260.36 TaxID=1168546 RepID=A0A9P4IRV8_9PEZI|nr:hypothetical protein K461DRAFT_316337 [Myriangium duriaei CBS 260.36]
MHFEELMVSLGGSCFAEEYHDRWSEVELDLSVADRSVMANLRRAIFQALRGRIKSAMEIIDEGLADSEQNDPVSHLQLSCWKLYFICLRRWPPLLRFRPERGGQWPQERSLALEVPATLAAFGNLRAQQNDAESYEVFETQVLECISVLALVLSTSYFTQNQAYPAGRWKSDPDVILGTTRSDQLLDYLRTRADELGQSKLAIFLLQLRLETFLARNSNAPLEPVETFAVELERHADYVRAGVMKMMHADSILCPGFSSPVVYNLIPDDSLDAGMANKTWDDTEDRLELVELPLARNLYEGAEDLFRQGNSNRGRAAISLRLGCIAHMKALRFGQSTLTGDNAFAEASTRLQEAESLAGLDEVLVQIIRAHKILLKVSTGAHRGQLESLYQDASRIGQWGLENHNEGVPHLLGWMMMRFSRRQHIDYSRMDIALVASRCAQAIFRVLDQRLPLFQVLTAEMELRNEWNDHVAARSLVDESLEAFRSMMSTWPDPSTSPGTLLAKYNLIITFGSLLGQVLGNSGDAQTLQDWDHERLSLIEDSAMAEQVRTAQENPYLQQSIIGDLTLAQARGTTPERAQIDQSLFAAYYIANKSFHEAIRNNESIVAGSILQRFVNYAETGDFSTFVKAMLKMYALFQLGKTQDVRQTLTQLSDEVLFDLRTERLEVVSKSWWRPRLLQTLKNQKDCDNALALCALAHEWDRGQLVLRLICAAFADYLDPDHAPRVADPWSRWFWAALIEEYTADFAQAFEHLLASIKAVEIRRKHGIDVDARASVVATQSVAEIFHSSARICIRCAEANVPLAVLENIAHENQGANTWEEHAFLFIARGNARTFLDQIWMLNGGTETNPSDDEVANQNRRRTHLLMTREQARTPEERLELHTINLERATRSVKDVSLESTFDLANIGLQEVFQCIDPDCLVIQVNFARFGTIHTTIGRTGILQIQRSSFRDVDVRHDAMQVMREIRLYGSKDPLSNRVILDQSLHRLSDIILGPSIGFLEGRKRLIFRFAVSQIPSLFALAQMSSIKRKRVRNINSSATLKLKAIVKANATKDAGGFVQEKALPMAGIEALTASYLFSTEPIDGARMTRAQFHEEANSTDVLVLATHGNIDERSLLFSSISLGEKLRIIDIIQTETPPALIVFAACWSGLGNATAGGDVTGFCSALLQMGCKAFIGTLWEVNDISTMFQLTNFYQILQWSSKYAPDRTIDEVLMESQRELASLDVPKAQNRIRDLLRIWDEMETRIDTLPDLVKFGRRYLERVLVHLESIDWTHPFHYAGITLYGLSNLKMKVDPPVKLGQRLCEDKYRTDKGEDRSDEPLALR